MAEQGRGTLEVVEQEKTESTRDDTQGVGARETEGNSTPLPAAAGVVKEEEPDDGVPKVLVTGTSGYIAQQLIKQLLEQGRYHVRGSVRNKNNKEKVSYKKLLFDNLHANIQSGFIIYRLNHCWT